MPDPWTPERVEALEHQVAAVLAQDLPARVRHVLEEYQALQEHSYRVTGALHEENRNLRAIVAQETGEVEWDPGDERAW